jgi:hypothetical protein
MSPEFISKIVSLRICVAFLGEKDQKSWWSSTFLSKFGEAFLKPVFPKTSLLARVNGASAAAQVAHDEHIGIGDVYHLFRLPENIEHDISQILTTDTTLNECFSSEAAAIEKLQMLAGDLQVQGEGPLLLKQREINPEAISAMASAYFAAFNNDQPVYPYYRGKA